jgi:hypothetical protein
MEENQTNIGEPSAPRYEFRTFGHHFREHHEQMIQLTQPVPEDLQVRMSDEVYIISKKLDDINIKIKNNLLDFKKLITIEGNLEQWNTVEKHKFPVSKELLTNEIFPALDADIPLLNILEFDIKNFLNIAKRHKDLLTVPIQKKRHAYIVNYTICEYTEVIIGSEYLYSVAVESTDKLEVSKTVTQLNLDLYENINYVQAIKRVSELISKPLAN